MKQPPWFNSFIDKLPSLAARLKEAGFTVSTENWLRIQLLLRQLQSSNRLPIEPHMLAAYIQPIICTSAIQQQTFTPLFIRWLEGSKEQFSDIDIIDKTQTPETIKPSVHRLELKYYLTSILLFIIAVSYIAALDSEDKPNLEQQSSSTQKQTSNIKAGQIAITNEPSSDSNESETKNIPIKPIPARTSLLPIKLDTINQTKLLTTKYLFVLSPLVIILILLSVYLSKRHFSLNRHKADKNSPLHYLKIPNGRWLPFSWKELVNTNDTLKTLETRRLDTRKTVDASVRQAGIFIPKYITRTTPKTILLITERNHSHDLQGAVGNLLTNQLKATGMKIDSFEFNHDLQYCTSQQNSTKTFQLTSLLSQHLDNQIIFVGDSQAFFNPISGCLYDWVEKELIPHKNKILLTTSTQPWASNETQLSLLLGFHIAPFSSKGLSEVQNWLHKGVNTSSSGYWFLPEQQINLPHIIRLNYDQWLLESPSFQYDFETLQEQLLLYCGDKGIELIGACAVYPQLIPNLVLILNAKLFIDETPQHQEQRLLKLNQLPWFRYGRFPDYLRKAFIKQLESNPDRVEKVVQVYKDIFAGLSLTKSPTSATLTFGTKKKRKIFFKQFENLLQHSPSNSQWADQVFIDIMFKYSGTQSRLGAVLPKRMLRAIRGRSRQHYIFIFAFLVAIANGFSLNLIWHEYIDEPLQQNYIQQIRQENRDIIVHLSVNPNSSFNYLDVVTQLKLLGFSNFTQIQGPLINSIEYGAEASRQAQRINNVLTDMAYSGSTFHIRENLNLQNKQIKIIISQPIRSFGVFTDPLINAYNNSVNLTEIDEELIGKTIPDDSNQTSDIKQDNPARISDFIRFSVLRRNSKLAGYRLNPGKDPELFEQAGFLPNDLAIKLDNYSLTDLQQAMTALRELRNKTSATITVVRDGIEIPINFLILIPDDSKIIPAIKQDSRTELINFINFAPVKTNRELVGYRVNPGKDPELFKQAGFLPNDFAIKLDNYDLSDVQQAMEGLKGMTYQNYVTITVKRDGIEIPIKLSIDENKK